MQNFKNFFKYLGFSLLAVSSSTAFVYIIGPWLNFDAWSPKFQFLPLVVVFTIFFGSVIYFFSSIRLNSTSMGGSYFHGFLVFLISLLWLFDTQVEYFYLLWSGVFFHYFIRVFLHSKIFLFKETAPNFKETTHNDDEIDYYSSYLFVQDCQTIYKSFLNTNKFNCFFYKLFGFGFCFYSYVSCHPKLCLLILWLPSLLTPALVLKLVLAWFLWGTFLFFLAENSAFRYSYNLIFTGKTYLKFSNHTFVWLLKLGGVLSLSFLLSIGFGLEWFSQCPGNCYAKTATMLWDTPIRFFYFDFCIATVFLLVGVCYLLYYSFVYSSRTWVFVFNACHFILYLIWAFLINYESVAVYLGFDWWWLIIGTGLYFVFWLICLVLTVRISTGNWEKIRSYLSDETRQAEKNLKPFSLSFGIKVIHQARLLHSLSTTKSCYNCTYMITIVHLYALAGWFLNRGASLNWLASLICFWFGWLNEALPFIVVCNGISSLFLFNLHALSCDPVWYAHFRKANGYYVLADLGWNIVTAAGLSTVKNTLKWAALPVGIGTSYYCGEIKGYLLGYEDGKASNPKFGVATKVGGGLVTVDVENWNYQGKYPSQKTEITLRPLPPFTSKPTVINVSKKVPVCLADVGKAVKEMVFKQKAPEVYRRWQETGEFELPVTVTIGIGRKEKPLNEEEYSTPFVPKWGKNVRRPWCNEQGLPEVPIHFPEAMPRPMPGPLPGPLPEPEPGPLPEPEPGPLPDFARARRYDNWDPDPSSTVNGRSIFDED